MAVIINKLLNDNGIYKLLLYGEFGEDKNISSSSIVEEIQQAKDLNVPIEVHINSIGGEVFTGLAILNALKECKNVTVIVDGVAASIASVVALGGFPVYMCSNASLMIHTVKGGCFGTVNDLLSCIEGLKQAENTLIEIISKKMKNSVDEVKTKYFDGLDHWIDANEALKIGLIDGVKDRILKANTNDNTLYDALNIANGRYNETTFKKRLSVVLSLDKNCSEVDIINAIDKLKNDKLSSGFEKSINRAISFGWINETDKDLYLSLAKADTNAFVSKFEKFKETDKDTVNTIVDNAVKERILLPFEVTKWKNVGYQIGAKELNDILQTKGKKPLISRFINLDRSQWTYDDWKAFDPKALEENPELCNVLLAQKNRSLYIIKNLDWYRKNDPVFLETHPDVYKELLERENNRVN